MNPNLARIALRPRGSLEAFDLGLALVRSSPRPFLRLAAITVLPAWLVCCALALAADGHPATLLLPLLLGPLLQAPFTVLTGRLLFAPEVPVRDVLRDTARRGPALLAAWGFELLCWAVSTTTCLLGAPILQAGTLFLTEAALLERVGPSRGLRRSLRLAQAQLPSAFVGALARYGLLLWCGAVAESTGQAVVGFVLMLGEPFGSAVGGQVTPYLLLGLLVAQPVHAIYRLLLYVDVRTQVEGWDLQVGLRAAGLAR